MTKEQWIADYKRIEAVFEKFNAWYRTGYEQNEFFANVYSDGDYDDFTDDLTYHPVSIAQMLQDNKFNMTDIEFMEAVQSEYDNLMSNEYIAQNLSFNTFEQLVHNS